MIDYFFGQNKSWNIRILTLVNIPHLMNGHWRHGEMHEENGEAREEQQARKHPPLELSFS